MPWVGPGTCDGKNGEKSEPIINVYGLFHRNPVVVLNLCAFASDDFCGGGKAAPACFDILGINIGCSLLQLVCGITSIRQDFNDTSSFG